MKNEKRKVILFGKNSFIVTLPQNWIDENNIEKGSEVFLSKKKNNLVISLSSGEKKRKERIGRIYYDNKPIKILNKQLISFYLKNFNIIEIIGTNLLNYIEDITTLKNKLSSVEITNVDNKKIVLEDLVQLSEVDLNKIIKNISDMLIISFENLEDTNQDLNLIADIDKNINKVHFLGFKKINFLLETSDEYSEIKDLFEYRKIISSLENIGDIIKREAKNLKTIKKMDYSNMAKMINETKEYFLFILKFMESEVDFDKNLGVYLNKKNSLLKSYEIFREKFEEKIPQSSFLIQSLKSIVAELEKIIQSSIDINTNLKA